VNGTKKHIVISGKKKTGKSELLSKILEDYDWPVYGFCTEAGSCRRPGYRSYYIFPYAGEHIESEENHIGDSRAGEGYFNYEVFDNYGVRLLDAKPDGIIVMDEIGFMEAKAEKFAARILELLDGDIPVIAVVKSGHDDVELLGKIRNHPNVELITLD